VTVAETLRTCLGNPSRFGDLRERVEILFDEQLRTWLGGSGEWLVVPLDRKPQAFYLLSEDREGQRRGREVLDAFLGPLASVNPIAPNPAVQRTDRLLELVGLRHISHIHRHSGTPGGLLARIEDAAATLKGRDANVHLRPLRLSHVDLLRDLRLALLQRNGQLADRLLEQLRLTGRLSSENLRFLTVEKLGRLERWRELGDLPHLTELLRARRPRLVNEILLEMVWHNEISELVNAGRTPREVFDTVDLGSRFGSLIGAVDIPSSSAGRSVGFIAALVLGDQERVRRLIAVVDDDLERDRFNRLLELETARNVTAPSGRHDLRALFDEGQYAAFIKAFLAAPDPVVADLAVQATLDSEDLLHASDVLVVARSFDADGRLRRSRRLLRDLDDLDRFVNGSCGGWLEWCERLAREDRWSDATNVVRAQSGQWESIALLTGEDSATAATALLDAWEGSNRDQVVASVDVLCRAAAEVMTVGSSNDLYDAILLILADQENLSAPVRNAYLQLLEQILESGPSGSSYREAVDLTVKLWARVAAASTVDWGICLVDVFLNAPAPNPDLRMQVVAEVINKSRTFQQRLTLRQQSELTAVGDETGVPFPVPERMAEEPRSPWRQLDGKTIGVYSLLSGAADSLARRLAMLCSPGSIQSNADTVATAALRSMATRVDILIVDTRHAAHAATEAIDAVRARDQQVFPTGRGVSSFMQALEQLLST
jgi:hypothetical protein